MKKFLYKLTFIYFIFSACFLFAEGFYDLSDRFHFGRIWNEILSFENEELLYKTIAERRDQIHEIKQHWRKKIEPFKQGLEKDFYEQIKQTVKEGQLLPIQEGFGGVYLVLDKDKIPRFVIKPIDEALLCLNNHKFYGSPLNDAVFRPYLNIPLYQTAQREALAYAVAQKMHFEHLNPKTVIDIIKNDQFHDICDVLEEEEKEELIKFIGPSDKEKLCSVQEFIPNITALFDLIQEWIEKVSSDEEVMHLIDQNDFEDLMLFIWTIFDNDAHVGNIYAYKRDEVYRLIKIDNGLTFPQKNCELYNALAFFPNANFPLSSRIKTQILELPISEIVELMNLFEMHDCIDAFLERMHLLQQWVFYENLTYAEIDARLLALKNQN